MMTVHCMSMTIVAADRIHMTTVQCMRMMIAAADRNNSNHNYHYCRTDV